MPMDDLETFVATITHTNAKLHVTTKLVSPNTQTRKIRITYTKQVLCSSTSRHVSFAGWNKLPTCNLTWHSTSMQNADIFHVSPATTVTSVTEVSPSINMEETPKRYRKLHGKSLSFFDYNLIMGSSHSNWSSP